MKTALLIGALGAILALALWGVWPAFVRHGGQISFGGWLALGFGVIISLALGWGLMALSYHSARRGYDERARFDLPEDEGD